MSDDVVCPECAVGKCGNCDGTALDPHTDLIVACACGHGWEFGDE